MEERLMRHVADSAVIQTQIILSSHINGAGRLFGGQLMEWIDIVAGVVARTQPQSNVLDGPAHSFGRTPPPFLPAALDRIRLAEYDCLAIQCWGACAAG